MTNHSIAAHKPGELPADPGLPESLPAMHHSPVSRWVRLTGHLEGHFSLAIVNRSLAGELEKQTGG
ncbi:MAG TPA: hypothetical protein GX696_04290, partial [Pseudomonadaceae bacterium]|nr:hypothetical protein [Pseudomonadaceae bacterium]